MFTYLENLLLELVHSMPLELFVLVASFVEEVVAPIPSPAVMLVAGVATKSQDNMLFVLIPLAIIGAFGKTLGALVVYSIADKAEDLVMNRFAKFFNVTHADVEKLGSKLGKGMRDYFLMTFLRAIPFVPSVVLTVGSGLLKVPLPLFAVSTFLGTIVRDGFYLYAGYVGTTMFLAFISKTDRIETYIQIAVAVVFIYVCTRIIKRRNTVPDETKIL